MTGGWKSALLIIVALLTAGCIATPNADELDQSDVDLDPLAFTDTHAFPGGETAEIPMPGEALVARLQLEPLDVVVHTGERLVLVLHQGSYGDHIGSVPSAPILLETGGEASTMTVWSFERDPSAFFTAPGK